jgi:malate dehydrogenase (quinone)
MAQTYDVLVIGGGICGSALFYQLARHTSLGRIALLEKYGALAMVNSNALSNSQTLHCGDIETNYTFEKAKKVKAAADKLARFAAGLPDLDRIMRKHSKMVLGVGEKEVAFLRQRFETFRELYPHMRLLEKTQIAEMEPNVVLVDGRPRPEEILALGSTDEYTEMDFGAVAHAFAAQATSTPGKVADLHLGTKVLAIQKTASGFSVKTSAGIFEAGCVVVSAGAHSLLLAQSMGYGLDYSTLPVAGSFYYTPQVLNGKVYTVQNDKLPFAAIHGDPDILVEGRTRFGPTALVLPRLERYHGGTTLEFLRTLHPGPAVAQVLWGFLKDPDIRRFMLKNMIYEVPGLRRRRFLQEVRKIVPSMQLEALEFAPGIGGVRPQVIDRKQKKLLLGEAKIDPGNGILFNMTPSPGATSCLDIAEGDAKRILELLGK